jgi:hypothetical protein
MNPKSLFVCMKRGHLGFSLGMVMPVMPSEREGADYWK